MSMQEGPLFVPASHYISEEFARLEKENLWKKIWQVACREEDIPKVGSQTVYDVVGESIIVLRSGPDEIRAFYNACPHRGRALVQQDRVSRELVCPFHGWRFGLDGKCKHVPWADGWGDTLDYDSIGLTEVKCDRWGGFVYINMDDDCEPLVNHLAEAKTALDPYEIDKQRWRWAATVEVNCNWKLAIEAFVEAYHVQTTHRQILPYFDGRSTGTPAGKHGFLAKFVGALGLGQPSPLLNQPPARDSRPLVLEYLRQQTYDVEARYTHRDLAAASRVLTELPEDATGQEINLATIQFRKEAAIAAGVGWAEVSPEHLNRWGGTFYVFPNMVTLMQPTGSLWYRLRPFGDGLDPEKCLLEFYSLERYAPGFEPPVTKEYYEDWREFTKLPSFLAQDFDNLPYMQKGVRSKGFKGAVTHPQMEGIIVNYHKHLCELIGWKD